jgi:hypothetical protein
LLRIFIGRCIRYGIRIEHDNVSPNSPPSGGRDL